MSGSSSSQPSARGSVDTLVDAQAHTILVKQEHSSPSRQTTPTSTDNAVLEKVVDLKESPPDSDARPIHGWKWFIACAAIYLSAFLYGLDTTIAADIQPDIVKSLGDIEKLTWVGTGFPLGSVAIILPLGYAYGIFEIKTLYLSSIVLFEIGSALCGAAPNMNAMIVGRIIAGAGGAGIYLGLLNYIAQFTSLRERNMYNALSGMVWGLGTILGPLLGGGFAISSAGWRWSFYINLVLAAAFAPFMFFYLPRHQPEPLTSLTQKLKRLDFLGILLIASTYTTYTIALTFGGGQWPWNSYKFAITIAFFAVILITFIITQRYNVFTTKERRVFPAEFLKSRTMVLLYISSASTSTVLFFAIYYIPLYFQFARGDSPILAAVRLLPFIVVAITFILLNGALMPIFKYYQPWYVLSGIFQLLGAGLWYGTVNENTSNAAIYGYSVLLGIGTCACQAAYAVAATKTMKKDPSRIPAAIGFINIAQIGTIVIALTISGAVFQNLAFKNLKAVVETFGTVYSDQQIRSALAGKQAIVFQQWNMEQQDMAIAAIIKAMNSVFILSMVAGVVTLLSSFAMRRERLQMASVAGA